MVTKWRDIDRFFTFSGRCHYIWKVLLDHNDQAALSSIVLYFFGLARHKFTKKDPSGVHFSNSLNRKRRRVIPLSDSLKPNDIGFRRNDAHKHMLSPSRLLIKITRVLASNGGENGTTIIVVLAVCRSWTWHLSSFVSGWGHLILFLHLPPWVWVILFDLSSAHCLVTMTSAHLMSNTAKSIVVSLICSREVDLCRITTLLWYLT